MGKYAISKLSIILYHKQMDLSIGFAKVFEKVMQKPSADKAEGFVDLYFTRYFSSLLTALI